MTGEAIGCHLCGSLSVETVPGFEAFRRVTSDCRPWKKGGRLCVCGGCGLVQKAVDPQWEGEVIEIYRQYQVYHQGGGHEQSVFSQADGAVTAAAQTRSGRLIGRFCEAFELPQKGRLLDIGCGNGAFLQAFSGKVPGWTLAGSELDDQHKESIEGIEGAEGLYTCPAADIPGVFDLITMIHSLEHIPDPGGFLTGLAGTLAPDARLLLQVPCFSLNPFDLLIADHCSHFTPATLVRLLEGAGFEVLCAVTDWIDRELSLVARVVPPGKVRKSEGGRDHALETALQATGWLDQVLDSAASSAGRGDMGVFGTSIAAGWLGGEVDAIDFFVDEDPHRAGGSFLGRPVYAPGDVPAGVPVFVALPWPVCGAIATRLEKMGVTVLLPPQMKDQENATQM